MGFAFGPIEVTCDWCGLETEPVDSGGNFDIAATVLKRDGWAAVRIAGDYEVVCPECQAEADAKTSEASQ